MLLGPKSDIIMNRLPALLLVIALSYIGVNATAQKGSERRAEEKPNILYILADDLGWNDVGFHNDQVKTPHIDSLAKESVLLNRFYVCPVCSPTRAGVLTGRYPIRFGMQEHVISPTRRDGLPPSEFTLPEMLGKAGYKHRAAFGKWHLGLSSTKFHPLNHGFTQFYGHYNGAIDYFSRERAGELDWHRDYDSVHETGYSTDLVGKGVVDFIQSVPKDEPFFAYVAFNAPHSPIQAKEEDLETYGFDPGGPRAVNTDAGISRREQAPEYGKSGKGNTVRQTFLAMTYAMDRQIGAILMALEERKIADNTIVIFHSDNGGIPKHGGNNQPLRGDKFTTFEGGVKVVSMVRWPQRLDGGRTVDAMLGYIDWWPTLAKVAGYDTASHQNALELDGINMLHILEGKKSAPDRVFYLGKKTVANQCFKLKESELFDLKEDPSETKNLAEEHGQLVEQLKSARVQFEHLTGTSSVSALPEPSAWPPNEWKLPVEK